MSFEDQLDFATKQDVRLKYYMKELSDSRSNAKDTTLQIGDKVLVKQPETDKLSTPFKPVSYEIVEKKGSMLTDHVITRNSSFMKKIPEYCGETSLEAQSIVSEPAITPETLSHKTDTLNIAPEAERGSIEISVRRSSRNKSAPVRLKDYVSRYVKSEWQRLT